MPLDEAVGHHKGTYAYSGSAGKFWGHVMEGCRHGWNEKCPNDINGRPCIEGKPRFGAAGDILFNEREEKLKHFLGQLVEEQNKKFSEQKETDRRMLQKQMDELKGVLVTKLEEYQKQQNIDALTEAQKEM
uniref:Uncharacterized protein n=1 Tax=Globodera pallida TaxID=36090 RepID=A0A183CRV8_GLOPA